MPVSVNVNGVRMTHVREVPGAFRTPEGTYFYLDPQYGWYGPYRDCTGLCAAKVERELSATKPFGQIEQELKEIFGLEAS